MQSLGKQPARATWSSPGFTLVELMVGVAVVGVLATLSINGFRQYLGHSKSAEALNTLGALGRAVHVAAERDRTSSDVLGHGASSTLNASKVVGSASGKG